MRVLIGCERFGVVRDAFNSAGHDAWSCDLVDCVTGSDKHYKEDVISLIERKGRGYFDLIILHPDCTALTVAGNHVYAKGKDKHQRRIDSIKWTEQLWSTATANCKRVALENPQGVLSTQSNIGKPQYIQPFQFGEDASKKTGLWLHGVDPLIPTGKFSGRIVEFNGKLVERWSNQTDSGQNKLGPSSTRAMERAKTYPGIAKAMVTQWGQVDPFAENKK